MSIRRRGSYEEHENHERWLVSYADLVTLLFAFFVVMYSMSSVNEGKFRVLSASMMASFKDPTRSLNPIQIGELVRSPKIESPVERATPMAIDVTMMMPARLVPKEPEPTVANESEDSGGVDSANGKGEELLVLPESSNPQDATRKPARVDDVADRFETEVGALIDDEMVEVRRQEHWLEVEIKTSILFGSGDARLAGLAVGVLSQLAEVLKTFSNPIQVEGFTDDVPISTSAFPSNWELSAARAASVVHLFMKAGVAPHRMVALGYGEHRPIADNGSAEGRQRNRRVVLVIPAEEDSRKLLDIEQRFKQSLQPGVGVGRDSGLAPTGGGPPGTLGNG